MKGLLMKDLYVLSSQAKIFLLMTVVFAIIPDGTMSGFAAVYAAMLPYTSVAYDERSKWDRLAAMLPYSDTQLVLSKYVLGYVCVLVVTGFSLAIKLGVMAFAPRFAGEAPLAYLLPMASVGGLILALTLPFMMRFGVEKGRMIYTFGIVILAVSSSTFLQINMENQTLSSPGRLLLLPLLAVAANVVSVFISIKLYPKRTC